MKFNIFCDESRPDLLCAQNPGARYMVIGSLWLQADDREAFKSEIHVLRNRHKVGGEFKWQKVSPSRRDFYSDLVDWFMAQGERVRFRCIAVDHKEVNLMRFHGNDQELGFYKFYYQLLHHWIMDFNEYTVFCDFKKNRVRQRLEVLRRCLDATNLSSHIQSVQAVRSEEAVLIQLVDVLTGIAASRLNGNLNKGGTKDGLVTHLERQLGRTIQHTRRDETKFNVFVINLSGGW